MLGFAITIFGLLWFSFAAFYGAHLGDAMTFHMVLAIGNMVLGAVVAFVGMERM